ncbi:Uncharacterised protein [Chlamydia trachomatis]|nr:Uncharacterised protein [Chlamydia trachomatis]
MVSSLEEKTFIGFPLKENTACVSGFREARIEAEADSPSVMKIEEFLPYRELSVR